MRAVYCVRVRGKSGGREGCAAGWKKGEKERGNGRRNLFGFIESKRRRRWDVGSRRIDKRSPRTPATPGSRRENEIKNAAQFITLRLQLAQSARQTEAFSSVFFFFFFSKIFRERSRISRVTAQRKREKTSLMYLCMYVRTTMYILHDATGWSYDVAAMYGNISKRGRPRAMQCFSRLTAIVNTINRIDLFFK